jgi:hypothetical protein
MAGTVDRLLSELNKAETQLNKAKEGVAGSILDIEKTLKGCSAEAAAIGGKINQIVPPHLQAHMDKLLTLADQIVNMADEILTGSGQSSIETLKDTIINMPIKETLPQSDDERRAGRKGNVDLTPKAGPSQSAVKESWREMGQAEYKARGLDWNHLTESGLFGPKGDDEFGLGEWTSQNKPIDSFNIRQRVKESIERDDLEDLGEKIQESMDGKGHFDWKAMNSPIGSIGNSGMDFSTLKSTGRHGDDISQINIVQD